MYLSYLGLKLVSIEVFGLFICFLQFHFKAQVHIKRHKVKLEAVPSRWHFGH
jgi:hypothetical protein